MKEGIHPEYKETVIKCACGATYPTRSTKQNIHVEICSACHPFYTGKQKLVDTAGMVEKFQKKMAKKTGEVKRAKGKKAKDDIGIPDFDRFDDTQEIYPGWEIPVLSYFHDLGTTATYTYDYGDSWQHSIQLEGYLFKEKNVKYPICMDGERACPPEDCGGVNGYIRLLKTLSDPEDADYEAMKVWVGKDWDPEKFDKNSIRFDNPYNRWKKAFLKK